MYLDSVSFDDYEAVFDNREKNILDESFINSLKDFEYNSATEIVNNSEGNINYSPISFYMALAIGAVGTDGETRNEFLKSLSIEDKDNEYIMEQNGRLFRLLYTDNEIKKLKIANSVWLGKESDFEEQYKKDVSEKLYSSLYTVDFKDNSTADKMSKWISDNTNGILKPKVEITDDMIMSIINTIYFKDQWVDEFDKSKTKEDIFYLDDKKEVKCDFMNMEFSSHSFVKGDRFTAASLSLKDSNMTFILPDDGVSVKELISSKEKVKSLFEYEDANSGKVIFKIPKFSFSSKLDLRGAVESLGIKLAFDPDYADLSKMTKDDSYISNIKQESHIAIDEKGVEAAAFTEIDYDGAAPITEDKAEMILNRPFIYGIEDNNGVLLFVGICENPVNE